MNNTEKIEMNIDDLWELWDRETNKDKKAPKIFENGYERLLDGGPSYYDTILFHKTTTC